MAGELNDAVQEEIPMTPDPDASTSEPESIPEAETPAELEPSADIHTPQADGDPEPVPEPEDFTQTHAYPTDEPAVEPDPKA